ncbi:hypothetical protein [Coleofasciculus sp. G2-EDA-02]|uniref:hypothetical protein n=1 Tax=Coleofasciculus sp. G2-EDA-02 TaxID=3069529 RepID=UPI0032F2FAF9
MSYQNSQTPRNSLTRGISVLAASSALVLGIPLLLPGVAQAQNQMLVAETTAIAATSAQNQTLHLNNDRVYSYNLEVSRGTTVDGMYIPVGATILGRYEPASGGLRYVATGVRMNGRTYNLDATSEVLEDQKDPRDTSAGAIAEDAGIGAAGGAILGEVFGNADIGEILGGAVAGGVAGNVTADRVVVVEPEETIILYSS